MGKNAFASKPEGKTTKLPVVAFLERLPPGVSAAVIAVGTVASLVLRSNNKLVEEDIKDYEEELSEVLAESKRARAEVKQMKAKLKRAAEEKEALENAILKAEKRCEDLRLTVDKTHEAMEMMRKTEELLTSQRLRGKLGENRTSQTSLSSLSQTGSGSESGSRPSRPESRRSLDGVRGANGGEAQEEQVMKTRSMWLTYDGELSEADD